MPRGPQQWEVGRAPTNPVQYICTVACSAGTLGCWYLHSRPARYKLVKVVLSGTCTVLRKPAVQSRCMRTRRYNCFLGSFFGRPQYKLVPGPKCQLVPRLVLEIPRRKAERVFVVGPSERNPNCPGKLSYWESTRTLLYKE